MFKSLFNPDNALMFTLSQITDCIFLSLFWLLGCFPVVTAGASFAALYDASFRGFRKKEKNSWQRFGKVFKNNWKAGILPSVTVLGLFWALLSVLIRLWNMTVAQEISLGLFSGCAFAGVVALGILSLVFPMLSRFENSFGGLMKNCLILGIANLPRTVGLGIVNGITIFLCVRYVFPLFFLPSQAALLGSWLIEPVFKPFMPEESVEEAAE